MISYLFRTVHLGPELEKTLDHLKHRTTQMLIRIYSYRFRQTWILLQKLDDTVGQLGMIDAQRFHLKAKIHLRPYFQLASDVTCGGKDLSWGSRYLRYVRVKIVGVNTNKSFRVFLLRDKIFEFFRLAVKPNPPKNLR